MVIGVVPIFMMHIDIYNTDYVLMIPINSTGKLTYNADSN